MKWTKHILIFVGVFLVASMLFRPANCGPGRGTTRPPDARVVELVLEGPAAQAERLAAYSFVIRAEVADTKDKRTQGLTGRRGIESGYGMLYVYDPPQQPRFSGAGNPFDVSLAFLREDGTIIIIDRARAGETRVIEPEQPISYVLEVRDGWFEDRQVRPGARLTLPPSLRPRRMRQVPTEEASQPPPAAPQETPDP